MSMSDTEKWAEDIFRVFIDHHIRQVAYVPDMGHSHLIRLCHDRNEMATVVLTTEQEGVALLAGAWLGGQRGALLMQSSGVGNCMNMLSLTRICRMPLLILVTMRGQWGEFNPWQIPMGQNTEQALTMAGVMTYAVDDSRRVKETVEAAVKMAFEGPSATAVLISQRMIGAKTFTR